MFPVSPKAVLLLLVLACCVAAHVIDLAPDPKTSAVPGLEQSGASAVNDKGDSHRIKHMHDRRFNSKENSKKYPKAVKREGTIL